MVIECEMGAVFLRHTAPRQAVCGQPSRENLLSHATPLENLLSAHLFGRTFLPRGERARALHSPWRLRKPCKRSQANLLSTLPKTSAAPGGVVDPVVTSHRTRTRPPGGLGLRSKEHPFDPSNEVRGEGTSVSSSPRTVGVIETGMSPSRLSSVVRRARYHPDSRPRPPHCLAGRPLTLSSQSYSPHTPGVPVSSPAPSQAGSGHHPGTRNTFPG